MVFSFKIAHETHSATIVQPHRFPYSPLGSQYRAIGSPFRAPSTCSMLG